jgi:hypothetical protein
MYHLRIEGTGIVSRVPRSRWNKSLLTLMGLIPSSAIGLTGSSSPAVASWLIGDLKTISHAHIYPSRF